MPITSPKLLALEERLRRQFEAETPDLLVRLCLSQDEVDELLSLVPLALRNEPATGLRLLAMRAPTTLALFLAWQGIHGYSDGSYWPAVRNSIGAPDEACESMLGPFFVKFVRDRNMAALADQEGHRYVAPILLHGAIPVSCLPELFREIVWRRLVKDGNREYSAMLSGWRRDSESIRESGVQNRIDSINQKRADCRRAITELTAQVSDLHVLQAEAEVNRLRSELDTAEAALTAARTQLGRTHDMRILGLEGDSLEEFDKEVQLISQRLGQLRGQQRGVEDALSRQLPRGVGGQIETALLLFGLIGAGALTWAGHWAPAIPILFLVVGGAGRMCWRHLAMQRRTEVLLAKRRSLHESVESLVRKLAELGRRAEDFRPGTIADMLANPDDGLAFLQDAVDQSRQEIVSASRIMEATSHAIRELETRRNILIADLRQAESGLDASRRSVTTSEEAYREAIKRLKDEMDQFSNELLEMERQFELHPLMLVDRPIRRFLLYGGSYACELMSDVADWLEQARTGKDVPLRPYKGHYRELVRQAFLEWWKAEGRSLVEVSVSSLTLLVVLLPMLRVAYVSSHSSPLSRPVVPAALA
jgi:hypothetical protein